MIRNINTRLAAGALALTMGFTLAGQAKANVSPNTMKANIATTQVKNTYSEWGPWSGWIEYDGVVPVQTSETVRVECMSWQEFDTASEKEVITKLVTMNDYENIVWEVIKGNLGNGEERKQKLAELGYDYRLIQSMVSYIYQNTNSDFILRTDEFNSINFPIYDIVPVYTSAVKHFYRYCEREIINTQEYDQQLLKRM